VLSSQPDGNAHIFAAGHRRRLEILSSDGPCARPGNGISTTCATTVRASIPIDQTSA
jgi:hypothetical protein